MKQLDFDDLIQPPIELNISSCYSTLVQSWVAEQSEHCTHPSLFRSIFYAHGWEYFCLGLLKVINSIGSSLSFELDGFTVSVSLIFKLRHVSSHVTLIENGVQFYQY